jgi:CheY-like chemotaxis protein/HPt (histidine-containing phosphotransfer) domain-containing protein
MDRHIRHSDCLIDWPDGRKVHLQHAVDITELVSAKEAAEQSNHSKGIFIAQMSHEIRTPMNAILGISEIQLHNNRLSSDAEEGFRQIYDSGNLLLNIINDILDFSKIDAGKMEIVQNKYDIPSLVNDTMQLCRLRSESKPIEIKVQVDVNMPLELIGDEVRIRQILNNLLSNACKYTDEGEVILSVSSEPGRNDEETTLVLVVSDTGQGITKDQINRIFDEYMRFNMEKNHGIPGTGLGMNITRRLVDMMGGEISAESEVDKGTVFTVRLPQESCGAVICGVEIAESLQNFKFDNNAISKIAQIVYEYMPYGRVLIVDDVESNLYVAKGLLLPYGLKIETSKSGAEAIEKIKNGNVYDIVFMDHMMPVMDGMEATRILRDRGYNEPIVALTANAISGQAEMFLANGFDRFISKPIDSRELDAVLTELIRDKKPPEVVKAAQKERNKAVITQNADLTELEKYFVKDAQESVRVMENVYAKINSLDDGDFKSYKIAVHGIKNALKNIGETKLSEFAFKLEKASDAHDLGIVTNETPPFISKIKTLVEKLRPKNTSTVETSYEDMLYLKEKLSELIKACETYSVRASDMILNDLKQKMWTQEIDDAINEIALSLLCGDFKKAVFVAGELEKPSK